MNFIQSILKYDHKPEMYAKSTSPFWNDKHISKSMLELHFSQKTEAASRSENFIDQSVKWITSVAPSSSHKSILDVGCGPGIYTEKLSKFGYQIAGIDISARSIDYAKEVSKKNKSQVEYTLGNYLEIEFPQKFDLITFIYCDFGALSSEDRKLMLDKIFLALNPGGILIFDVCTPNQYLNKGESSSWYSNEGSGFWKPVTHICLEHHYIYNEFVRLNQYIVVDELSNVDVYQIWDTSFSVDSITKELKDSGFKNIQIYSDVSGKPYDVSSRTMAIVVQK